jgi:hypothetical protein
LSEKQSRDNFRSEEIRGLFVLGLLAVLISVKLQSPTGKLDITLGELSTNLMPLLDNIIVLWSLYAFFMVLGLSEDVLGKNFSRSFLELAKSMLRLNFFILAPFAALYGYLAYPTRLPFVLALLSIFLLFGTVEFFLGLKNKRIKTRITKLELKQNRATIMSFLLLFFVALIFIYPDDWIRFPAFLAGAVSILGYLVWYKEKKPESARLDEYCR